MGIKKQLDLWTCDLCDVKQRFHSMVVNTCKWVKITVEYDEHNGSGVKVLCPVCVKKIADFKEGARG